MLILIVPLSSGVPVLELVADSCSRDPIPARPSRARGVGSGMDEAADSPALLRRVEELQRGILRSSVFFSRHVLCSSWLLLPWYLVAYWCQFLRSCFMVVWWMFALRLDYSVSCGQCKILSAVLQTT
jgi:hypothetical protein